ncbi:hypothetical protein CF165_14035 [Amycolatopsis vastitatis]|uniref:NACHT domain-containing protein n=2 Tax=Amycolatopsis vastitatis TaxID=1905142 RepID=A0A229TBI0_9PSEU|nr:hypothetical protein CF165_14035 [Amycolatopsis vastitatis]
MSSVLEGSMYTLVTDRDIEEKPPSDIHRDFLKKIEPEWEADDIGELARGYGRSALTLCCHALSAWVRIFPSERAPAAWTSLVNSTRLIDSCRSMLLAVRKAGVPGSIGAMRVVGTQRRDISSCLSHMELFGLPVEKRFRRVPIAVSYLAGKLSSQANLEHGRSIAINKLIISLANEQTRSKSNKGIRLIITGKAGCGKTTAVQWLAFTASQQGLQGLALPNRPLLPLFVRLRETIMSNRAPSDRMLLYSAQLQDEVASGWLQDCHASVTPLILLDGWDEISPSKRSGAEEWVGSLTERFPDAHIIATSRPEGINNTRFDLLQFKQVSILPLRRNDSAELAERWFNGLLDQHYASAELKHTEVERARRDLLSDLGTPAISDMADSPLLVSMLCCLYATGKTTAPDKRGKLYDLVVSTLLDTRERDRGSNSSDWNNLDLGKKETLVGAIAMEMTKLGAMTLPITGRKYSRVSSLTQIISDVLVKIGRSSAETPRWVETVLSRSIVLQRVANNEAEFAHRSIQDYLAAKSLRQSGQLGVIYDLADAGQWATLPFACYSADLETADKTINWILDRLSACLDSERRILLTTLVECLGASTVVSPKIRRQAEAAISEILPPADETESKALASLGNAAIPYLASSRVIDEQSRRLSINVLARIGTVEAMNELTNYARDARDSDLKALTTALERFDPEAYSKRVLAEINADFGITLTETNRISAISDIERLTRLTVQNARLDDGALNSARHIPRLRQLDIRDSENIGSIEWTASVRSLRSLSISRSSGLSPLKSVGPPELWALHLADVEIEITDWKEILQDKQDLRILSLKQITGQIAVLGAQDLRTLKNLTTLAVAGDLRIDSLDFVGSLTMLSRLVLERRISNQDLKMLSECANIRNLDISFEEHLKPISLTARFNRLQSLTVHSAPAVLLDAVPAMPNLTSLSIEDSNLGSDEFFSVGPEVKKLTLVRCTLENNYETLSHSSNTDRFPAVRELIWRDGHVADLRFLRDMPTLRSLEIEDNGSIQSLDGLEYLKAGCKVRIAGTRWGLDDEPVQKLRRRCEVVYEPEYDSESFTKNFWVDYGGS